MQEAKSSRYCTSTWAPKQSTMLTDFSGEVRLPSRRAAVADDRLHRGGIPPLLPVRRGTGVVHAPG